jgi:4-hydroxy-4-methyl-2-oxoglutarate aldolase
MSASSGDAGTADSPGTGDRGVLAAARQIAEVERDQAGKIQAGQTLRQQTAFSDYLARRPAEPSDTFRQHLRRIGGAVEE